MSEHRYEFYIYAKDEQMTTQSGAASFYNKGIGIVILFSNAFPAAGPIIKVIGIKNHPLVHPNAADLAGNGGIVSIGRFSEMNWSRNCVGEAFVDHLFAGIAELDNLSESTWLPHHHHTWT